MESLDLLYIILFVSIVLNILQFYNKCRVDNNELIFLRQQINELSQSPY